jgi:hypothetical protein
VVILGGKGDKGPCSLCKWPWLLPTCRAWVRRALCTNLPAQTMARWPCARYLTEAASGACACFSFGLGRCHWQGEPALGRGGLRRGVGRWLRLGPGLEGWPGRLRPCRLSPSREPRLSVDIQSHPCNPSMRQHRWANAPSEGQTGLPLNYAS